MAVLVICRKFWSLLWIGFSNKQGPQLRPLFVIGGWT